MASRSKPFGLFGVTHTKDRNSHLLFRLHTDYRTLRPPRCLSKRGWGIVSYVRSWCSLYLIDEICKSTCYQKKS